jgi:hypothetical protein
MKHLLFEMLQNIFARPVFAHESRFVLAHLTRHFVRHLIDRGVHVVTFFARFDRDVIRTNENDFRRMPVLLHFENNVSLDDLRIIEMQALDFFCYMIVDRISDLQMTTSDFNRWMSVCC